MMNMRRVLLPRILASSTSPSSSMIMKSCRMASTTSDQSILFHEVVANINGNVVANKVSFKLDKGDRVALTGPNQEGNSSFNDRILNVSQEEMPL